MSTARRDLLHQIEVDVQKKWEDMKIFEVDAPSAKEDKFMCTFPYPYMNGLLHIGHGFSLTKAIFAAHFNRLLGKKVLFPFGFHCTGMPIQAAANKLKREFEVYGSPVPTFPAGRPAPEENEGSIVITDEGVSLVWKQPAATGSKTVKAYKVMMKVSGGDFKEVKKVTPPEQGKARATAPIEDGGCVYKIVTELSDGSCAPESKESDMVELGGVAPPAKKAAGTAGAPVKRVAKKVAAKSGDAAFQYEILLAMGLKKEDLPPFTDPMHWLQYFPPLGVRDLKRFGVPVDFRRSFITTSVNPYYDSFIRWQFGQLKKKDKIGFGKRPTIYSELDQQACMDHDRAEGEGVGPQEYTAIKIELLEPPASMSAVKGKKIYLLAATLRAETMPGQTNCWILPEGNYGVFKAKENEVYVCSHRAARNMSFQDILTPWGKPELLCEVKGQELLGCKVSMPTSKYPVGHLLPLLTIKMDKGTGVVTSVPSDSPDDYAAFMDLMKPGKREHYGIEAEWVEPFEPVPIISVEIDGEVQTLAAKYMCEKLGVQSQKDKEKLAEAHDVCYKLGFDKGTMLAGPFKGMAVKKAKFEFRQVMINDGQAFIYNEPEKLVIGRSGDECVVAGIDQWYLKYGQSEWKKQVEDHINSDNFSAYNDRIKESFVDAIGWLKEWACSRSFGLGTRVPWDEKFLIESLSDSTIYMAYYTVAHFLQGDLEGTKGTDLGKIKPEDLSEAVWDYVFLNGPLPKDSKIPKGTLEKMRTEFRFWYPMDLRVSGKDLIQNHLTMALYNHASVWDKEPEMWPRSIFCNGWLLVNNEKMSKSKGNFFTLEDIVNKYSADSVRLAMANSGDTLEPANFDETVASKALLSMPVFLETMKAATSGQEKLDGGKENGRFVDRWFANTMNRLVEEAKSHYERMYYREALRTSFYEFSAAFDQYRDICRAGQILPNKVLFMRYLEWQMIILSPITPHFCEHGWGLLGKKGSVLDARWPTPTAPVDLALVSQGTYMYDKVPHDFIKLQEKAEKSSKPPGKATKAFAYVAKNFPEWKVAVLAKMKAKLTSGDLPLIAQDELQKDDNAKAQWKSIMTELMSDASLKPVSKHVGPFAAFKRDEAAQFGASALEATVPFDELELLKENLEYLKDKLKVEMSVCLTDSCKEAAHKDAVANAQPGAPSVFFEVEAGAGGAAAPKAGAKAKAKADAKGAAKGAPNASGAAAISDVKKLDEHLSTRSYFEGGARPTAGDVAQYQATPSNVDHTKYPHAARWYRHIGSFTPAQRANW